jgi:hypothetical protein
MPVHALLPITEEATMSHPRFRRAAVVAGPVLLCVAGAATFAAKIASVTVPGYAVPLSGPVVGTVSIDQPSAAVVVVSLSSSNPQVVAVPSNVPIQPGSTRAQFVATGAGPGCARLTAKLGDGTRTDYVVVHPASSASTLTMKLPNQILPLGGTIPSSVGTGSSFGTADVVLSSSNPAVATVPASVRLMRGSASFGITTRAEGCAMITATLGSQVLKRTIQVVYIGG